MTLITFELKDANLSDSPANLEYLLNNLDEIVSESKLIDEAISKGLNIPLPEDF